MMKRDTVYTGFWINYSEDNVMLGSTLTLREMDGTVLLAVLALLVSTAGQSFWTIASYFIHQIRCKQEPQHPLHYQQQAVLRNSETSLTTALRLAQLSLKWRSRRSRSRTAQYRSVQRKTSLYIALALTVSVGFSIIGTFASQLITKASGSPMLLRPVECGYFPLRDYSNPDNAKIFISADSDAQMYAGRCYEAKSKLVCNSNIKRFIPYHVTDTNVSCPFKQKACQKFSPVRMDTGLIDSTNVLGLNAKVSERLQVRKVATCAPIQLSPYLEHVKMKVKLSNNNFNLINVEWYMMGPRCVNRTDPKDLMAPDLNSTFIHDVFGNETDTLKDTKLFRKVAANVTYQYVRAARFAAVGYDLRVIHSELGAISPTWFPHEDFTKTLADVAVFFLATNDVKYLYRTFDPFFKANQTSNNNNITTGVGEKIQAWLPDRQVTSIGCIDQYQICNVLKEDQPAPRCTSLGPVSKVVEEGQSLGLNPYQNATLKIIGHHLHESGIYNSASSLGSAALKAGRTAYAIQDSTIQTANISEVWWQNEVQWWFNASLASLQLNLVKMVGELPLRTNPETAKSFSTLTGFYEKEVCSRQLAKNVDGYQNFSTLYVSMIVFLSFQMILVGYYIHVVGGALQGYFFGVQYPRSSWSSDGYLQLQRQAYEGAGHEGWDHCRDDDVPLTMKDQLLGIDISDVDHPRLKKAAGSVVFEDLSRKRKEVQTIKDIKRDRPPRIPSIHAIFSFSGYFNRPLPPLPV